MNCDRIRELLITDYADGELSEKNRVLVETHTEACPDCQRVMENIKSAPEGLFGEGELKKAPYEVWHGVRERIAASPNPLSVLRAVFLRSGLVLAVLFLSIGLKLHFARVEEAPAAYVENEMNFLDSLTNGVNSLYEDIGIPLEEFLA